MILKTIIRQAIFVGVLGVFYYGIYWYSGVWEIPMLGFVGTVLTLGVFDLIEYRKEKDEDTLDDL